MGYKNSLSLTAHLGNEMQDAARHQKEGETPPSVFSNRVACTSVTHSSRSRHVWKWAPWGLDAARLKTPVLLTATCLDCMTGTEHTLAIALQLDVQKQLLRIIVAAHRVEHI